MTHGESYNEALAKECASAFYGTAGVGCVISDAQGQYVAQYGYGCQRCGLCEAVLGQKERCTKAHMYGMSEAERFGGKYIYYCPMGLVCFVSPILAEVRSAARITVGPFFMVDKADFIACELEEYHNWDGDRRDRVDQVLEQIPVIPPKQVEEMSNLLYMAVGFMNNLAQAYRLHTTREAEAVQGHISDAIVQLKTQEKTPYPIETEEALLSAIRKLNKDQAQERLNELLGYILFSSGGAFDVVKDSIGQLLVLIGRTAISTGTDSEWVMDLTQKGLATLREFQDAEHMCFWLTQQLSTLFDGIFQYHDARHANLIHRCVQHIETHYWEEVSLEALARSVYLSPTYLSRIFHKEMGETFSAYLNRVRIEKSKALLRRGDIRLIDIALAVGFQDQSYFTKVFKRLVGITPNKYRDSLVQKDQPI